MPATAVQDNLSDDDIALLAKIGEFDSEAANDAQRAQIERLLTQRYIELDNASLKAGRYQLTGKAENFLTSRGAGLNEA